MKQSIFRDTNELKNKLWIELRYLRDSCGLPGMEGRNDILTSLLQTAFDWQKTFYVSTSIDVKSLSKSVNIKTEIIIKP